jgi:hypothetical protein
MPHLQQHQVRIWQRDNMQRNRSKNRYAAMDLPACCTTLTTTIAYAFVLTPLFCCPCPPGPVLQVCQQLVLTICRPSPTAAAAAASTLPDTTSSSGSTGTAASPAQQRKGTPSGKQKQGRPGTPGSSSKGGKAGGTAPGGSSFEGLKASEAAAEWQQRLLAAGIDWTNPEAQQVLQRVAAAHLQGLLLLPGEMPLNGSSVAHQQRTTHPENDRYATCGPCALLVALQPEL